MLNLLLPSVLFLTIGLVLGFYIRTLTDKLKYYKQEVQAKVTHRPSPKSSLLEPPLTLAERVARDQEELLERLNPQ